MRKFITAALLSLAFSEAALSMTCEWTCTQQDDYGICVKWISKCTSNETIEGIQSLVVAPNLLSNIPTSVTSFETEVTKEGDIEVRTETNRE
jgi:hypothetical protein